MEPDDRTDGELLRRFADSGCEAAFDALVRRHGAMVAGVCRRGTGCAHDADDVAQSTFVALASAAGDLRGRPSVAGWLHRTAWHLSLRSRRAASARRRLERREHAAAAAIDAAQAHVLEAEARRELDRALGLLGEEYRVALVLHHLEGMTVAQVAGLLGCPQGTAAARLSRGRSLLRERLRWRGLLLVAGSHGLSAAFAEAAESAEAAGCVGVTGRQVLWDAGGWGAGPAVRRPQDLLPTSPAPACGNGTVAGGATVSPTVAVPPAAATGAGALPAWFVSVGRPVAAALAVAVGTGASAATITASYQAWVESRPVLPSVSLPSDGGTGAASFISSTRRPEGATADAQSGAFAGWLRVPTRGGAGGVPVGVIPEPSSLALIAVGGLALLRRRR